MNSIVKRQPDLFDQFFGPGWGRLMHPLSDRLTERLSSHDGRAVIELELAGVDPDTVRVSRRPGQLRVSWTSRLGKVEVRDYEVDGDPVVTYDHGLLRIEVGPSPDGEWSDVPISRK